MQGASLKQSLPSRKFGGNNGVFWLMLIPTFIFLVAFNYAPMFGIVVAFKNYNYRDGILGSPWYGLKNFDFILKSGKLTLLIQNTLLYNIVFIITGTVSAILIAVLVSEINGSPTAYINLHKYRYTCCIRYHFLLCYNRGEHK